LQEPDMKISSLYGLILAAGGLCIGSVANAAGERGPGWEFGADLIYQLSKDIDFNGGSKASLDDDLGIAIAFGYRFNNKLELQFYLDWNDVDYNAHSIPAPERSGPQLARGWVRRPVRASSRLQCAETRAPSPPTIPGGCAETRRLLRDSSECSR